MGLRFRRLHPLFAAQASGVDIARPLAAPDARRIAAAMDRYGMLVFHAERLSGDQQLGFARAFGPLTVGFRKIRKGAPHRLAYDELADISNVGMDGEVTARDDAKIVNNIANQLWHSDSSFQQPPALYSMLYGVAVPPKGGETEFCDLRSAYDALPAAQKAEIAGLRAEHYALHSRFLLGDTEYTQAQQDALPPVEWPLVRTHPGSGRKVLWVGAHARRIQGMTIPEGRLLLMDLLEHATRRRFVYRHRWKQGDLLMWDNRALLHRGRRFDFSQRREMRRATVEDAAWT